MKIEEYIASGIIENYLLGVVSPQEKQEVECMSHIYPEIKQELNALELAMENFLLAEETPIAEDLWLKIEGQLEDKNIRLITPNNSQETKVTEIVSINRPSRAATFGMVASIAAILIIGFFFVQTKNKLSNKEIQLASIQNKMNGLKDENNGIVNNLNHQKELVAFLSDPNTKSVTMKGMPAKDSTANSQVCWNAKSKKVMLCIGELPANPGDMQYQLWAMVDGKPVDLGVFDADGTHPMIQMNSIENPQAFAVTLERKGGSSTPNLNELYVLGAMS
ncbi:MAG: anti-sigma factor [Crocinitomicaceae bacterium]